MVSQRKSNGKVLKKKTQAPTNEEPVESGPSSDAVAPPPAHTEMPSNVATKKQKTGESQSTPPPVETTDVSKSESNAASSSDTVSNAEQHSEENDASSSPSATKDTKDVKDKAERLESAFLSKLSTFVNKFSLINKEVKDLQSLGKTLEKDFNAVIKVLSKQKVKSKTTENRTLSGFAMPSLLSAELYDFLNIEKGTMIPRKDVTKLINEYIKTNNLRNEDDKRKIIPDANLKRIFNCGDEDTVTYFNLQTYMKHHFIKETGTKPNAAIPVV